MWRGGGPSRGLAANALRTVPFALPQTGEGIAECEVVQWHVAEGDEVERFTPLVEVQSDKATISIPSRFSGKVVKLYFAEGEVAAVGATLVDIETDQPLPKDLEKQLQKDGSKEEEGAGVGGKAQAGTASAATPATTKGKGKGEGKPQASPAVRSIAREHDIDLTQVVGTGPGGRVLKGDVLAFISGQAAGGGAAGAPTEGAQPAAAAASRTPVALPAGTELGDREVPIRGYHRGMVRSMTEALKVPLFHYHEDIDVGALLRARAALQAGLPADAPKITLLPFLVKALSHALREFPALNSRLDFEGDTPRALLHKGSHNVGIAMDTPTGLVVPVVKGVDRRSAFEVALELDRLRLLAQEGRIPPEDLEGGTITVSNIGAIGGTYAAPIPVPPETAIVALGRTRELPRFGASGDVERAALLPVSWGADHRAVDGATVARCCARWKALLESPAEMLLHSR